MLHIIKQYRQLFMGFIISNLEQPGQNVDNIDKKPLFQDEFIKRFEVDSLDYGNIGAGLSLPVDSDAHINRKKDVQTALNALGYDISYVNSKGVKVEGEDAIDGDFGSAYKRAMTELQKDLGVEQTGKLDEKTVEKMKKVFDIVKFKRAVVETARKEGEELNTEVVNSSEKVKQIKKEFDKANKTKGKEKQVMLETRNETGIDEEREDVDEKNFIELLKKIDKTLMKDGKITVSVREEITPARGDNDAVYETRDVTLTKEDYIKKVSGSGGHLWIERIAKKLGYEDNRSLWTKITSGGLLYFGEKNSFNSRVENVNNLDLKDFNSIKDYLFDFDSDGDVDSRIRDALTEKSIDDYVKSTSEIQNIIENLGFGSDLKVLKNLSFRDQFADRIVEAIKMGPIPFVVLIKKGGYNEFMKKYLAKEEQIRIEAEKAIDSTKLEESVMVDLLKGPTFNNLSESEKKDKIKEAIAVKKDATIAISMGYIKALGVNIDLSKLTDGIIDGFNIGINEEKEIGVGINKSLLEKSIAGYGFNIVSGLSANGVGVNASVSRELGNQIEDSTLNIGVGAGVGISFEGAAYSILSATITNPSVDNVEGINRILSRETKIYDEVMKKLVEGETDFTDKEIKSWYDKSILGRDLNNDEIKTVKDNIKDLINKYETLVSPIQDEKNKEAVVKKLKKAVLENMINSLYTGAEGLQLTGIGGFIIPGVVSGVFPILEYNWITHDVDQNKLGNEIASEMTKMSLRDFISKYGDEYIKVNGNELLVKNDSVNFEIPEKGVLAIDNLDGYTSIKAEEGVNLNAIIGQRYIADKKEDATFKKFTLVLESSGEKSVDMFNKFPELRSKLNSIESGFNYKTRFNVEGELLNPEANLTDRWNSLLKLANLGDKYKDKKYFLQVPGVGSLGKTDLLNVVSDKELTNTQKEYIISRISQFLKKAKDFDSGDMNKWNKNTDKYIDKDKKRRGNFDKVFGYSLTKEAEEYYKILSEGKGKIGSTSQTGLSFDAAATLVKGKSDKGVDIFKGDCEMLTINGKPVKIEITDSEKIEDLKQRAFEAGISDVDSLEFYFYKDPHGFDDRIMVGRKTGDEGVGTGELAGTGSTGADHINQVNHSLGIIPVWTWDESEPGLQIEEPTEEPTEPTEPTTPTEPTEPTIPTTPTTPTTPTDPAGPGSEPIDADPIEAPAPAPEEEAPSGL